MKKLFRWLSTTTPSTREVSLLLIRLSTGVLIAATHGLSKVRDLDAFVARVDSLDVPSAKVSAISIALAELLGGILLTVGLFSRVAASLLLLTMGITFFRLHDGQLFAQKEYALVYGLIAAALLISGPGRASLDQLFFGRSKEASPSSSDRPPS